MNVETFDFMLKSNSGIAWDGFFKKAKNRLFLFVAFFSPPYVLHISPMYFSFNILKHFWYFSESSLNDIFSSFLVECNQHIFNTLDTNNYFVWSKLKKWHERDCPDNNSLTYDIHQKMWFLEPLLPCRKIFISFVWKCHTQALLECWT